ncbi:hypothetical protein 11 [Diadegma semiclausum ichnovirus]|nr:hypothetical protein 11 [Diadegma semiclausum ichnovirus]
MNGNSSRSSSSQSNRADREQQVATLTGRQNIHQIHMGSDTLSFYMYSFTELPNTCFYACNNLTGRHTRKTSLRISFMLHILSRVSVIRLNAVRAQRQYAPDVFWYRTSTYKVHQMFWSISAGVVELALAQGMADTVDTWHESGLLRRPFHVQQWTRGTFESATRAGATIGATLHGVQR